MKKFVKSIESKARPGFRTPSTFRANQFANRNINLKFNPGSFKIQHKG